MRAFGLVVVVDYLVFRNYSGTGNPDEQMRDNGIDDGPWPNERLRTLSLGRHCASQHDVHIFGRRSEEIVANLETQLWFFAAAGGWLLLLLLPIERSRRGRGAAPLRFRGAGIMCICWWGTPPSPDAAITGCRHRQMAAATNRGSRDSASSRRPGH